MRTAMTTVITGIGIITRVEMTFCALHPFCSMPEKRLGMPVSCPGNPCAYHRDNEAIGDYSSHD